MMAGMLRGQSMQNGGTNSGSGGDGPPDRRKVWLTRWWLEWGPKG